MTTGREVDALPKEVRPVMSAIRAGLAAAWLALAAAVPATADVPVRVVRFGDLQPAGAGIDNTFESIGFDSRGRVYVALCNGEETPGVGNCYLFRWNPRTGERRYLDNFLDAARRANNLGPNQYWDKPETLVKGHTHLWHMNGQMWMGTMNVHGYDDYTYIRGMHLMALDIASGVLTDHAKWQPKGVFHEGGGTYTLEVMPGRNLVLSIGVPNCTIIVYNPTTRETKRVPGIPKENNPQLSGRDMTLLADGNLLYQCGSGSTPFGLYNVKRGTNEQLNFKVGNPLSLSYARTSDRKSAYISDNTDIYRFDLATKSGKLIAAMDPAGGRNQCSPVNLSLDERKLYYVINKAGGEKGPYVDDLYEYDLDTGKRTLLMNLRAAVGGGVKFSGSHMMAATGKLYLAFQGEVEPGIIEIDLSARTGPKP
jgi:hypothetical protein